MQEVDHGYKFPLRLFTETGEVLLSTQAELIKYLRSPACSGLYNIPRVELSALASLIGAQVHVLRPSAGGAGLLNLDHPWDWTTYDPISPQSVDPNGRFYRGSEMYLITEDEVHFFRLSSSDATLPREGAPDVDGTDEAIINEAQEQVEIERFDMVPIATFAKRAEDTDVFVQEPGTNIPVPTELRRSNRKSSRTERYNSYHETREKSKNSKRHKRAVNDYEKVVSEAIVEEPIEDTGVDKATDLDHENPDRSLENETNFLKEKLLAREREETKLRNMGHEIRNSLSLENIRQIINDNLEYFRNIVAGKKKSWRFQCYNTGKIDQILFHTISEPFSDEQQEVVIQELRKHFLDEKTIMSQLFDYVLMPEAFIRIYQVYFNVSNKQADHNLLQKGVYYQPGTNSSDGLFL